MIYTLCAEVYLYVTSTNNGEKWLMYIFSCSVSIFDFIKLKATKITYNIFSAKK